MFFEVRAADHHFVEDVARFVIIGVGDGPVLGLCDFYQPHEFGHREGEQFADPSSDRLLAGDEYAFVTGVHVAVEGVCGVAVFVVNHLHLDVDDRHGVEQVRIFRQTFRFPLPGRFHAVHHANAPLLDADEGQQQIAHQIAAGRACQLGKAGTIAGEHRNADGAQCQIDDHAQGTELRSQQPCGQADHKVCQRDGHGSDGHGQRAQHAQHGSHHSGDSHLIGSQFFVFHGQFSLCFFVL